MKKNVNFFYLIRGTNRIDDANVEEVQCSSVSQRSTGAKSDAFAGRNFYRLKQ